MIILSVACAGYLFLFIILFSLEKKYSKLKTEITTFKFDVSQTLNTHRNLIDNSMDNQYNRLAKMENKIIILTNRVKGGK